MGTLACLSEEVRRTEEARQELESCLCCRYWTCLANRGFYKQAARLRLVQLAIYLTEMRTLVESVRDSETFKKRRVW